MNPYEVTTVMTRAQERAEALPPTRWTRFSGLIVGAGLIGYFAPIVALGLLSWLVYGRPAAMDNLERVAKMHRQMNINYFAVFTPNIALMLIVAVASSKSVCCDGSQKKWWIIGGITLLCCIVVSFATARWNLIPWRQSPGFSNAIRSATTLVLPIIACVVIFVRPGRKRGGPEF